MGSRRVKRQTITHVEEGYHRPSEGYRPRRDPYSSYPPSSFPEWYAARDVTDRSRDYADRQPFEHRRREGPRPNATATREAPVGGYAAPYFPRGAAEADRPRRRDRRVGGDGGGAADEYYNHPERFEAEDGRSRRSSSSSGGSSSSGDRSRKGNTSSSGTKRKNKNYGQYVRPWNVRADHESRAIRKKCEKECPGFDWSEGIGLALTVVGAVVSVDKILEHMDK